MEKKLLVAVDGSVYSLNTLYYLSNLFENLDEVGFHILYFVPAGFLPTGHELLDESDLMNAMPTEAKDKYDSAQRYVAKAVDHFIRLGVDRKRITSQIRLSRASVATDIIRSAQKGLYDALIIGRRGLSKIEEFFMGSVSAAVLEKCRNVPIWIIDGHVDSRKFMVPVDGSPYTLQAVDHLGFILKNNPYAEITLFHSRAIFANKPVVDPSLFYSHWDPDWCKEHLNRPDSHFHGPEQLLLENGFPAERIHRRETSKGMYPSRQIVRQALMDDFGTIVMGRRPGEMKKGFLGSVSGDVLAMAVDTAIWIVG